MKEGDWNSNEFKGGLAAGLAGAWLGEFACHLVGVSTGIDIPNGAELAAEFGGLVGFGVVGARAGAELDWRRKLELENQDMEVPATPSPSR